MTVYFIGTGPGALDLLTIRGLNLLRKCMVILYAGSLISREIISEARPTALYIDSSKLTLNEILGKIVSAHLRGEDTARLHSGDPSLYGATAEQMRRLTSLAVPYEVIPGVPSFAAAAATLATELTRPGVSQTVILTRTAIRTMPMPPDEDLRTLGRSKATLILHLSINALSSIVRTLIPYYGAHCPTVVVYRASWPDEYVIRGTLLSIRKLVKDAGLTRTSLILIGPSLGSRNFYDSCLYSSCTSHSLRPPT